MGRTCSLPSPPRYAPGGRRRFGAGQSPAPKPKARPGALAPGRAFAGALRPRRPPRDAAVSCALPAHPFPQLPRYRFDFLYPLRVPPPFPLRNPPYPKSLLETAEGGFQGRAIRSPWRSTPYTLCIPGRGPRPFRPPLPPRNFSGVWGRSRPQPGSRGAAAPGRGGANITKYLLPNPYRNLHLSPYLHIKRPPLGRWHRKPSPLGGAFL
mgnify:CR=1 FL=1